MSPAESGIRGADFDTSTPAVVLKFDPNVLHHGGLGVIRGLGRRGVPMYAVHEDRWSPAAHSRYLRGRWLWHPSEVDGARVVDGLRALAERIGRPAVLLPTDDAGAIFLAERGAELREAFLFAEPPDELPRRVAGKHSLHEICQRLDVPHAESRLISDQDDAFWFAGRFGYPLVVKLAAPWCGTSADRRLPSTSIVRGPCELSEVLQAAAQAGSPRLVLQEFVPGRAGHDWFFHGYCDARSHCEPAYTGLKERSYPAHAGLTSLGRCVDNPALRAVATGLLRQLGFRGIVDLDFRYDPRDGQYKLLDFNPRLGAQFRLFNNTAGIDVALAAYLDLTGQEIPAGAPLDGRSFLVENYDPVAAAGYWRRGELRMRDWLGSLRSVRETAWFSADDLMPFGLMSAWMARRATSRLLTGSKPAGGLQPDPVFHTGRGAGRARTRGEAHGPAPRSTTARTVGSGTAVRSEMGVHST